jgi:hypothetical protein
MTSTEERAQDLDTTISVRVRAERPIMQSLLMIPFVCGGVVALGMLMSDATAAWFYRGAVVTAAFLTAASALVATTGFGKSERLFAAWSALGIGYALSAIRHSMYLWMQLQGGGVRSQALFDSMLIAQNILVALALWWFVRSWQTSGLAAPVSRRVQLAWVFLGIAVAIVVGGYPLVQGFATAKTDMGMVVSTAGDMVGIALIVPLAMPALAMRGGLLMHTWLYLAASELFWLLYDVWVSSRAMMGLTPQTATGLTHVLRMIAIMFAFVASVAHRRARF